MTPQEIIREIQKLPRSEWNTIKASMENASHSRSDQSSISEDEVLRILYAKGVIGNIPDLTKWTDEDEDWEPIEIPGRPTSELIIEDRG